MLFAESDRISEVLIPLLLDDPLWVSKFRFYYSTIPVLIPLLLDDPLWGSFIFCNINVCCIVLIPLLLDDPLWEKEGSFIIRETTWS